MAKAAVFILAAAAVLVPTQAKKDRNILIDSKKHSCEMRSVDVNDQGQHVFVFRVSTAGFPNMRLKRLESFGTKNEKSKASLRLGIVKIAEVNGSINAAQTTSFVKLTGKSNAWGNVLVTDEANAATGTTVRTMSTMRTWPDGMVVKWEVFIAEAVAEYTTNATKAAERKVLRLDPLSARVGVHVDNYPFKLVNSTLSIVTKLTGQGLGGAAKSGDALAFGTGLVSWDNQVATTDGTLLNVAAGAPEAETDTTGQGEDDSKDVSEDIRLMDFKVESEAQPAKVDFYPTVSTVVTEGGAGLYASVATVLLCVALALL